MRACVRGVWRCTLTATRPLSFTGVTQHNPDIQRAPDGTYLLFYMGATANNTSPKNCTPGVAGLGGLTPVAAHQRIGVATAKSPYGPWTRPSVPVRPLHLPHSLEYGTTCGAVERPRQWPLLLPSFHASLSSQTFGPEANDPNAKDSLFVTNPSPIVLSNGTILLIYKVEIEAGGRIYKRFGSCPSSSPLLFLQLDAFCSTSAFFLSRSIPRSTPPLSLLRLAGEIHQRPEQHVHPHRHGRKLHPALCPLWWTHSSADELRGRRWLF